ncbi:addiction module protein [Paludisphaera mucosa]|uniref:Addiction module protein n=1 Tax=Paludisphaera mucosa TaxID=3030827 RepID=A0ABT6FHT3_9BACT|nr:addiction module protein [Paludisphaera mucosa]MDG3007125.1 addiction module protein [Paludisphaera mucosa]
MDLQAVLSEIRNWTVEDQLRLIEEVWDGLTDHDAEEGLAEDVKELLDRRIEASDKAPAAAIPWEEVQARALERFRK